MFVDVPYSKRSVLGLVGLMSVPEMISQSERVAILTQLMTYALSDVDEQVRNEATLALVFASSAFHDDVITHVFSELQRRLSEGKLSLRCSSLVSDRTLLIGRYFFRAHGLHVGIGR